MIIVIFKIYKLCGSHLHETVFTPYYTSTFRVNLPSQQKPIIGFALQIFYIFKSLPTLILFHNFLL